MILGSFLILTFAVSLTGFACILLIPAARSPESAIGLPFWLIMVWGPSIAALILSAARGETMQLLSRIIQVKGISPAVWLLVAAPLAMLWTLRRPNPATEAEPGLGPALAMVGFNLVLGPLGEEMGWRGVMQDHLTPGIGWLAASLAVGVVWLVWHLPLWLIDSPHAQIALPLFAGHCLLYAVIIGAAHTLSGGSLLPAILLHLTVNLASNFAIFAGFREPNAWFRASLPAYAGLAGGAVLLVIARTGDIGFTGDMGFDAWWG